MLKGPDLSQPFVLQTDASERGIGAVLSQYVPDGAVCDRREGVLGDPIGSSSVPCVSARKAVHHSDGPQILGVVPPPEGKQLQAYALESGLTAIQFYCGASKRKGQR